jgi:hypothetical protein
MRDFACQAVSLRGGAGRFAAMSDRPCPRGCNAASGGSADFIDSRRFQVNLRESAKPAQDRRTVLMSLPILFPAEKKERKRRGSPHSKVKTGLPCGRASVGESRALVCRHTCAAAVRAFVNKRR